MEQGLVENPMLKRGKVLLIAPRFFGYDTAIQRELAKRGYSVDIIPDRPSESVAFKSISRISFALVEPYISSYGRRLKELIARESYDLVLFLGGMSFCFKPELFSSIRETTQAPRWIRWSSSKPFRQCFGGGLGARGQGLDQLLLLVI